ncbi:outer membrane beta-barrel family protein [Chitinophaga rhizophila]|uniref:TonB-dependent receptor n=1 Tax=Chitinophaga rhizophila TaxID=2866212 RepID=A0ABS7G5W1_9BACT|nr:outer membrane beta-barrel family protein [Chitinophaga rhizophila]MBW8683035.1 TonB-dependent receptor [Chitinophaga rhizophila]
MQLTAQNKTLTGQVQDAASQQAVAYASISLLSWNDSSNVRIAIADSAGKYTLRDIAEGRYYIYTKCIGYKDQWDTIRLQSAAATTAVRNIVMYASENWMNEVVVAGRTPPIEVKTDRVVMNVAKSITATGSTLYDLLLKSPGVREGTDENIIINGKRGLQVYQDGRQLTLSGKELTNLLRSIQAADIATVEIITNPSARYEAAGNAGIINIKTQKGAALGFNGNANLTLGFGSYNPKYSGGLNLTYRANRFTVYGNYNYFTGNSLRMIDFFRLQQNRLGQLTNYDQRYRGVTHSDIHSFKAGADFNLSSRSTLGIAVDGNIPATKTRANSTTPIYQSSGNIDSTLYASNREHKNSDLLNYSVNYRYAGKEGREFSASGSYLHYNLDEDNYLPNIYRDVNNTALSSTIFQSYGAARIDVLAGKVDYQQQLLGGLFSAGAKVSAAKTDNALSYFYANGEKLIPDTARTNQFVYKENVYAGYINYSIKLKKWGINAGLRLEATRAEGVLDLITGKQLQSIDTQYVNLFPNVAVTYNMNDQHTLELSFNKRVDRPAYQDLNPFETVLDELSYIKGNPFLRPQFASTAKLSHVFRKYLITAFSYTDLRDYSVRYRDTIQSGKTFETFVNIAHQYTYNLSTTLQLAPVKWWSFYYTVGLYHQRVTGLAGTARVPVSMSNNFWSISGSNTFNFGKGWNAELTGFYNSKFPDIPAIISPQWQIDAGIQKSVLKGAGALKLSATDIFNSYEFRMRRDFGGLANTGRGKRETQQVKISFTYRFGNSRVKNPSATDSGLKEEKKRIK